MIGVINTAYYLLVLTSSPYDVQQPAKKLRKYSYLPESVVQKV